MFWRVFDPGEPGLASINKNDVLSLEFSHFMGIAFWAIYQATVVITLINILIAMMNNTFLKVSEHADLHWKYSKSYYQVQFLAPRAVLPAPFRFVFYFAKLMRYLRQKLSCCVEAEMIREGEDKDRKYLELLLKLVKSKQQ